MGVIVGSGDRCYVTCDDPHVKGCRNKTDEHYGQTKTAEWARGLGWYASPRTGKWTCPDCLKPQQGD